MPKLHFVHHDGIRLIEESSRSPWTVSPLATCVQQQEDFIGKGARLSRRVNATKWLPTRVMERSLICTMYAMQASDSDDRGL